MSRDNGQPPGTHQDNKASPNSKGKATDTGTGDSNSIASRLQASGRLALNAFGTGPDISDHRAVEKSSSSGRINLGRISSSTGEASSHRLRSTAQGESLRSQTDLNSGESAQAFNDFVSADSTLNIEDASRYGQLQTHNRSITPSDVEEQEKMDGIAVASLLDGPSEELDSVLLGAQGANTEDGGLTLEVVAKLNEALFSAHSVSSGPRWDNLLNFNPDFLSRPGPEAEFERQLHLGTTDTDEARNSWLQQWGNVLSGYTDHVWGDLEPLVAEARREIDESKAGGPEAVPEIKALDRLRQILAHVRGF
ncbi:hypothetical protein F53441_10990 [Fusarium austroafricanum]|uniref:Uncharacterized protein n=1 Tax=Fusarium austroafricanum TaxID=2364996 RepID=A0A8H4NUP7_9HYPO|nr:hypothetical protein F53441_10990 [Fusarium austroafricanum]